MPKQTAYPTENFFFRTTFARSLAAGVDPQFFEVIQKSAGMAVSQSSGNLVLTTGTGTNEETILRSTRPFAGSMTVRDQLILSQRIANNHFYVELVDVLGDGLAYTINSATSVTVTFPGGDTPNPFTADNIGQLVNLGAIAGTAGVIPGRYAIASVNSNQVTFTVSAWPSSGSGTLSLFGWNYHRWTYDGTTATNAKFDSQRSGWNSGDSTLTINTTASPGHCAITNIEDGAVTVADQLVASSLALQAMVRGSRVVNIPQDTCQLYLQIRALNGTTAPASTTTLTLGMLSVEDYDSDPVAITAIRLQSFNAALPVAVLSNMSSNNVVNGYVAHDVAISGNPIRVAGRAVNANYTAVSSGDVADLVTTLVGAIIQKPFSIPEADFQVASTLATTTQTAIKAAAGAGIRNYVTGFEIISNAATANVVTIQDGSTTIWQGTTAAAIGDKIIVNLATPLKTTANTALNITLGSATSVYYNFHGYQAP